MGASGRKRRRRRLPKLRARPYDRGGGVTHTTGGLHLPSLRIMDGGRDQPLTPLTRRGRLLVAAFFVVVVGVALAAMALTR